MNRNTHVSLRPGERVFINGAVIKVDRKVSVELLNNATFLLEHQILQPEQTTTPLRQIYFVLQSAVLDPRTADQVLVLYRELFNPLFTAISSPTLLSGIMNMHALVEKGEIYEALQVTRAMFPVEDQILNRAEPAQTQETRLEAAAS